MIIETSMMDIYTIQKLCKLQSNSKTLLTSLIRRQNNASNKEEDPLCLSDIMNNKPSFFIGRLVRIKCDYKDAKDGSMLFIYLCFVDKNGDLVPIYLVSRLVIKQSKDLKNGNAITSKKLNIHGREDEKTPVNLT